MNLRDLAKRDSAVIVEGESAGNTLITLSDPLGNSWSVLALLSDIGYEIDTDGNKGGLAGRLTKPSGSRTLASASLRPGGAGK